ncbi:nuclear transport factor 2 family protein [Profundibacter sp.]
MKLSIPLTAAAVAAILTGSANAETPANIARDMMQAVFSTFDAETAQNLLAKDYIQHNPAVPTGRAPIIGFIPALKESGITLTTHRILSDGHFVVMHNSYDNAQLLGADKLVGFDVFRIENGKVAEHWDNLTAKTPANPSGHSQTDGETRISDLDRTEENKALVRDFVETILIKGDMARLADFFEGNAYLQHNSQIGDGLDGLRAALTAMAQQGITMEYDRIHQVIGEGNFVFTMSEGLFADKPTAFFDLFRVENGKVAEHWDVISEIPAEMAHQNGKF